jgi:hypothetical protein
LEVGEVTGRLGRGASRVGQEDKGGRLSRLLGEGVVKHQAKHAALGDIVGAHRHLVGLASAVPLYGYEALLCELVLGGADIALGEEAGLRLGAALGRLFEAAADIVGVGGEGGAAGAGVFNDGEVSGQRGSACRTKGGKGGSLH